MDETDFTPKEAVPLQSNSIFSGNHLPFVGFTYTKGSKLSDLECLLEAGMLYVNGWRANWWERVMKEFGRFKFSIRWTVLSDCYFSGYLAEFMQD